MPSAPPVESDPPQQQADPPSDQGKADPTWKRKRLHCAQEVAHIMNILEDLRQKRSTLEEQIEGLFDAEDFNPEDETFKRAKAEAEALDSKIKAIVEHNDRKNAANAIDAISVRSAKAVEQKRTAETEHRSIGEAWTRSKIYEDYRNAPRGTSGHVHFSAEKLFRAPILTTDFGGSVYPPAQLPAVSDLDPATPLLNLMPRITVSSGSVEWVKYGVAPVAGKVAEGAAKPEAVVAPTLATETLDIIAHWIQYSRSVLEDQGALMAYINSALRRGVLQKVESEAAVVLNGATLPSTQYAASTGTLLEGIRLGIATVQEAGYNPTAVLLNPADYADLDISLMSQTVVNTGVGPQIGQTYWGVRPVPSSAITAGTAILGDFGSGTAVLMKSDVQVYTTDSHADTFASNVLTTLAEVRAKAIVQQPNALTEITQAV